MIARLGDFGRFWWDFFVGDDWRLTLAALATLAITCGLARSHPGVWWLVPAAILMLLPLSLARAIRRR